MWFSRQQQINFKKLLLKKKQQRLSRLKKTNIKIKKENTSDFIPANVDNYIEFLIVKLEGYTTTDQGGHTIFGISKNAHPNEVKEMKTLSKPKQKKFAKNIYYKEYWKKNGADLLPARINFVFFDLCVNSGAKRAKDILEKCKVNGEYNYNRFMLLRTFFYLDLVVYDERQPVKRGHKKSLVGWLNRLKKIDTAFNTGTLK